MLIEAEQLRNRTIVITGASSGIGKATAMLLGRYHAKLVLGGRDEAALREVAARIGPHAYPVRVDVTDEASVAAFEAAADRIGPVDALVNCAGTGVFRDFLQLSPHAFNRMVDVNLKGTFLTCRAFASGMAARRAGKIVNVISVAGSTALAGCAGYSASKFGVLGLTRVMQAELRGMGVQVTAVMPGAVSTPFWDAIDDPPAPESMIPVQSIAKHLVYILCQPEGSVIDEITIMPPLGIL